MSGEAAAGRGLWARVMNLFGLEEEEMGEAMEAAGSGRPNPASDSAPLLVSLPGGARAARSQGEVGVRSRMAAITIFKPADFDEAQEMVDRLRHRGPILVNFEGLEREEARRLVNFLSGALYALEAEMYTVGAGVCLIAPPSFHVTDLRGQD